MGGAALAEDGAELDWAAYDALIASIKAEADPAAREALMHEPRPCSWIPARWCPSPITPTPI